MNDTYDTHDLAGLRVLLGCERGAGIGEMVEEILDIQNSARRWSDAVDHWRHFASTVADALGGVTCTRTSVIMRRIEQLRACERTAVEHQQLTERAAEADTRWRTATQTLASLRAGIDALRAAARLDEGLTDAEVIEHGAAALERWREAAQPEPADLPPMVVGWRDVAGDCALVRVDGDDEPAMFTIHDSGLGTWRVVPESHHDGYAGPVPLLAATTRAQAEAMVLALARAANPDRRVELEAPCAT